MKLTKSKLKEMIRHTLDELAIQKTLKLSNDLEVDVLDDGSAVMRTKRGTVNLSPKNYKILSRSIKQGKMESVNERKWDITQKTQGGTDFRNTMAFHSRELQKVVSLYKNRHKVNKEEMKYYMNIWMKGFHQRLKSLGVLQ